MSGYIGNIPVPQATQSREVFTATSGQTTFATVGYPVGFVDVWLNGVKLVAGTDFTATNGSDVVLTVGATTGDTVEVISNSTFEVNSQTFTGGLTVNNDAATVLTVDRATSEGTLVDFKKDGVTVGNLGVGLSSLSVGTGNTQLLFWNSQSGIFPSNGATVTDNSIDFGNPNYRFKNLYLSGGIYLGGTGAANLLDDYETGTWTPTVTFGGGSVGQSYTIRNGYYTKIGQSVHVTCYFTFSNKGTSVGTAYITGLPFTSRGANCYSAGSLHLNAVTFADWPQAWVVTNNTAIQLQETTNAGTTTPLNEANFSNFSGIIFTAVYMTDA